MGQCGTMMMAASKRVHLVCALCGPHRLLVLIRYVDGSATTLVLDMASVHIIEFVGVSGGFRWIDVCSCQNFVE